MSAPSFYEYRDWRSFDVETSGELPEYALQPWSMRGWVRCFAVARKVDGKYVAESTPARADKSALWSAAKDLLAEAKGIVGWTVTFDAAWLIAMGLREEVMAMTWLDASLLWKHWYRLPESDLHRDKRKAYKLKLAVAEFLPKYKGYGDDIDFHGDTDEVWAELLKYNKLDAALCLKLAEFFWGELQEHPQQLRNALIEMAAIPLVADHFITGLYVDLPWADELDKKVAQEIEELGVELLEYGATPTILASPTQLNKLIYDDWGLSCPKETPGGARSTDKEALMILSDTDPRADSVRRYRELQNLRTKFIAKIVESCDYNENYITHPTAFMGGTYTGRMTFSSFIGKNKDKRQTGFALHQMSGDKDYRRIITVPHGFDLVEWDAANQEFRWMAIESQDETMLQLCLPGEDPHAAMAAEIYSDWDYRDLQYKAKHGDKKAGKVRKHGKVTNLSCQYRIGKPKFRSNARVQHGLIMSEHEASRNHDTYHRTYPGVSDYWRNTINKAKRNGYATTLAGRRVQLNVNWGDRQKKWMYESAAINFPIQGAGADQKYLAMMCLKPLLTKYHGRFYFELHDGLYCLFPTKVAEKAALEGRTLLCNLPYKKAWGFTPPIPLPWDLKMSSSSWGDLVEVA